MLGARFCAYKTATLGELGSGMAGERLQRSPASTKEWVIREKGISNVCREYLGETRCTKMGLAHRDSPASFPARACRFFVGAWGLSSRPPCSRGALCPVPEILDIILPSLGHAKTAVGIPRYVVLGCAGSVRRSRVAQTWPNLWGTSGGRKWRSLAGRDVGFLGAAASLRPGRAVFRTVRLFPARWPDRR